MLYRLALLAAVFCGSGCQNVPATQAAAAPTAAAVSDFVTVEGTHFRLRGKPILFRGHQYLVRGLSGVGRRHRRSRPADA